MRHAFVLSADSLLFCLPVLAQATPNGLGIDHRFANVDAQSLIGLPLGSHKTTVEKNGSLKWSQWSLKRK